MNWDDYASTWDEGSAQRAYALAALASLQRTAREQSIELKGARVCDFGCGTGLLTEQLAEWASAIDGVDSSEAMIAIFRAKAERQRWGHVRGHSEMPAEAGDYDLVVCSSVCAFVADYPAVVEMLASRLRPGGLFVQWDWELDPNDDDPFGLTRDVIEAGLRGAGLAVVRVDTAFELPFEDQVMRPLIGVGRRG